MDRKGDIGQTISSVIVFFAVFFLMVLFVIVVGNIAKVKGLIYGADNIESDFEIVDLNKAESQAVMDMFLSEKIKFNDASARFSDVMQFEGYVDSSIWRKFVNKEEMEIYDALLLIGVLDIEGRNKINREEIFALSSKVEKVFADNYACNGKNSFYVNVPISTGLGASRETRFLFAYPKESWIRGGRLPFQQGYNEEERGAYPFNDEGLKDGFYISYLGNSAIEVAIGGDLRC